MGIQNPEKLDDAVKKMYHKYVKRALQSKGLDHSIHEEFERQRRYLEQNVNMLKDKTSVEAKRCMEQNRQLIQQNLGLVDEIKALRKEIKTTKQTPLMENEIESMTSAASYEEMALIDELTSQAQQLRMKIAEAVSTLQQGRPVTREKLP